MDRDRLAEGIKTAETNESNINEGFVEWMKSSGMNILLVLILVMLGYVLWIRWQRTTFQSNVAAWQALASAELPQSLEDVAADPKFAKYDAVAALARGQAANIYLNAVLRGEKIGAGATTPPVDGSAPEAEPLDEATRADYLARAKSAWQSIVTEDDGTDGMVLHVWMAHCGLAAIAESEGDADGAKAAYEAAAARAEGFYPALATRARARAENAAEYAVTTTLPATSTRVTNPAARPSAASVDAVLESIITPDAG